MRRLHMWMVLWITLALSAEAFAAAKPALVVLIAIDQFRSDYLTRFERELKPGGFRHFMEKGAWFLNAQTAHAPNVTAVGHATMLTGSLPYLHGIVSNYWYDRGLARETYCVQDAEAQIVGGPSGEKTGRSPRNLLVTTVGDELKNAMNGKPRVVSVALKDRAAILMGGHRADLALWFNEDAKGWVSSSYYLKDRALPAWVVARNQSGYLEKKVPLKWTPLLPAAEYEALSTPMPDDTTGDGRGLGKRFPHPIEGKLERFLTSPWANAYTLETALEAVRQYKLGSRKDVPDVLAVSLSAFDALGHNYGPLSAEMQDTTVRLDRALAEFLAGLARQVPGGLANVALVLTADHGIQVNPALAPKLGLPGGVFTTAAIREKGNDLLRNAFGFASDEKPIAEMFEDHVWLDHELFKKHDKSVVEGARALASWLRAQPYIAAAYARQDALEGRLPPTQIAKRIASSMHPERSGDVFYTTRPGNIAIDGHGYGGTDHESATVQDASVPLIFVGAPFKPGRHYEPASLLDLAPTLSSVLGIVAPSGSEGHALSQALRAQAASP